MIHNSYCIWNCAHNLFFSFLANNQQQQGGKKKKKEQNNFIFVQTWFILKCNLIPVFKVQYIYKQNAILEAKKKAFDLENNLQYF